ncbi:MAG: aminoglycoside phosphotransferase [Acidimicrobiales bacterium]|nr:aminoglycoside phosphotransferase [Acidimicrobiales bacterium]
MIGSMQTTLQPRPLAGSVDELLDGAIRREPFHPADSRSGSHFERVWFGDEPMILKYLHVDDDFAMRATGDVECRSIRAWVAGLYDVTPSVIDHGIVGMSGGVGRDGLGAAILMRDLSTALAALGDVAFGEQQHLDFLDHLAAMSAATWGWQDDIGLMPYGARWEFFGHAAIDGDRALGWPERVPQIADEGWLRFAERTPGTVAAAIDALRYDVTPLAAALATTPSCFLHGDWKAGNLGSTAERTVLIDWVYLGAGPACHELGWYLALNRAKLPAGHTKERVIADFRTALERHGIATEAWWDRQLSLAMLGAVVQFGWEKALGDEDELGWWCDRAAEGLGRL